MSRKPLRRYDSGRIHQARRGVFVKLSCSPGPNIPSSTMSALSSSGSDGCSSPSTRSTSARVPTGSTVVNWSVDESVALRPVRRLMRIVHQPAGRHRIGCVTSTAWTRPGGTISVIVVNRPKVIRTPSGVGAIE